MRSLKCYKNNGFGSDLTSWDASQGAKMSILPRTCAKSRLPRPSQVPRRINLGTEKRLSTSRSPGSPRLTSSGAGRRACQEPGNLENAYPRQKNNRLGCRGDFWGTYARKFIQPIKFGPFQAQEVQMRILGLPQALQSSCRPVGLCRAKDVPRSETNVTTERVFLLPLLSWTLRKF